MGCIAETECQLLARLDVAAFCLGNHLVVGIESHLIRSGTFGLCVCVLQRYRCVVGVVDHCFGGQVAADGHHVVGYLHERSTVDIVDVAVTVAKHQVDVACRQSVDGEDLFRCGRELPLVGLTAGRQLGSLRPRVAVGRPIDVEHRTAAAIAAFIAHSLEHDGLAFCQRYHWRLDASLHVARLVEHAIRYVPIAVDDRHVDRHLAVVERFEPLALFGHESLHDEGVVAAFVAADGDLFELFARLCALGNDVERNIALRTDDRLGGDALNGKVAFYVEPRQAERCRTIIIDAVGFRLLALNQSEIDGRAALHLIAVGIGEGEDSLVRHGRTLIIHIVACPRDSLFEIVGVSVGIILVGQLYLNVRVAALVARGQSLLNRDSLQQNVLRASLIGLHVESHLVALVAGVQVHLASVAHSVHELQRVRASCRHLRRAGAQLSRRDGQPATQDDIGLVGMEVVDAHVSHTDAHHRGSLKAPSQPHADKAAGRQCRNGLLFALCHLGLGDELQLRRQLVANLQRSVRTLRHGKETQARFIGMAATVDLHQHAHIAGNQRSDEQVVHTLGLIVARVEPTTLVAVVRAVTIVHIAIDNMLPSRRNAETRRRVDSRVEVNIVGRFVRLCLSHRRAQAHRDEHQ